MGPWAIYLIAQNGDSGEWFELLVMVIFVAVWIIGGLLKAKKSFALERQQEDEPAPTREEITRAFEKLGLKEERKKFRTAKNYDEFIEKYKPVSDIDIEEKYETDRLKSLKSTKPSLAANESKQKVGEIAESLRVAREKVIIKKDEPVYIDLSFAQYNLLQRAVIYNEIIGKPVSLKDLD